MSLSYPATSLLLQNTAKIVTSGRMIRVPHIVRVRFVSVDWKFYVLAGSERSDWVLNSLEQKIVKLRLEEYVWNVRVKRADVKEKERVLEAFSKKYGSRVVHDWYRDSPVCLCLTPSGLPAKRASIKGENEVATTLKEWQAQNRNYYVGVSSAFDSAAEEYDFTIGNNYINTWIRKRSIRELQRLARPDDILVEIGCGTGAEAIEVSRMVSKIIATDISEEMMRLLRIEIRAKGLTEKIVSFLARASEIMRIAGILDGEKPRIVYSFNGALNCEPRLDEFVGALYSLLPDDGYFVWTIRNSLCLSEAVSHAAVLQFRRMAPRKKQPIMVSVGGLDIPSVYYSPSTFEQHFAPKFKLERLVGLPSLLPPAYLSDYYVKLKLITGIIERLETVLSDHFPLNRLGDQTLYVFKKV